MLFVFGFSQLRHLNIEVAFSHAYSACNQNLTNYPGNQPSQRKSAIAPLSHEKPPGSNHVSTAPVIYLINQLHGVALNQTTWFYGPATTDPVTDSN